MKAVIMAAGKSTRTYPLTLTRPKALLPVANKTIVQHQLDALSGIVDGVVLVVGYCADMIREHLGDEYNGMSVEYVEQREQKGTGHAILQCAKKIKGSFLAINGDDLYAPEDLQRLAAESQAALARVVEDPRLYGIYEVNEKNCAVRLVEKPTDIFSHLANIGAYKFTPGIFDVLAYTPLSKRGELEITSAIQTLSEQGPFKVVESTGYWLAIGYPWHLLDANAYWLDHFIKRDIQTDVPEGVHIQGEVVIGKGTLLQSGAVIQGPTVIGENCMIGPNCWIRPHTAIAEGCRVGQGSELKNAILMKNAYAPHHNYVGDSILGENVNLGFGTVTANLRHDRQSVYSWIKDELVDTKREKLGAFLGDDVHTGVNTSILPGRKLWPGVSTLPGEVVDADVINE